MHCESQQWHWIIFKVPPKITPFEFAKDVNVGDRVSVQCVVGTGDLPLTFNWLKDDVPINSVSTKDDKSITIRQNDEFSSALSINSLQPNQGGSYRCIVENDAAKEAYSAVLRVNGKNINVFNSFSDNFYLATKSVIILLY